MAASLLVDVIRIILREQPLFRLQTNPLVDLLGNPCDAVRSDSDPARKGGLSLPPPDGATAFANDCAQLTSVEQLCHVLPPFREIWRAPWKRCGGSASRPTGAAHRSAQASNRTACTRRLA